VTVFIESQTSKIPLRHFSLRSSGLDGRFCRFESVRKRRLGAIHSALGAPAFLILGLYNKMVKQNGTDSRSRRALEREEA
jgi:hypothetical protein